jgi:hypothetical protein
MSGNRSRTKIQPRGGNPWPSGGRHGRSRRLFAAAHLLPGLPRPGWRLAGLVLCCGLAWGCGPKRSAVAPRPPLPDMACTERIMTTAELSGLAVLDPALSSDVCLDILARLNHKDRSYVQQDLKKGKTLKVPNDFRAYLGWSPLPGRLSKVACTRQCILVLKDPPFLGWYEHGRLTGDTNVCIGKKRAWTKSGLYRVIEKDKDHVSASYRSAFGYPALMPYALKIYGRVWIHGGDVTGGYCSHGCINLPLDAAEKLYEWAKPGTIVIVAESLEQLAEIAEYSFDAVPQLRQKPDH